MSRSVLLSQFDTTASEKELDFYLNKAVDSYREMWRRRNRLIALSFVLASSALIVLYSQSGSGVDSQDSIQVSVVGLKLSAETGASVLTLLSLFTLVLSVFARISYKLFRLEIEELHNLRFGTNCPVWSLTPFGPHNLINIARKSGKAGWGLFLMATAISISPHVGIMIYIALNFRDLTLFNSIVYSASFLGFIAIAPLSLMVERDVKKLISELRARTNDR